MSDYVRRQDLARRITWAAHRVMEYGEGTVAATASAEDYCRQIQRDAQELEELMRERLLAIDPARRYAALTTSPSASCRPERKKPA